MKFTFVFLLAIAVSANGQNPVQPYVVPIYRAIAVPTTSTTDSTTGTTESTTTASVATSPTTSQKPTIPAVLEGLVDLIEAKQIRHPRALEVVRPKEFTGLKFEHVCSGTLIGDKAVITTVTCIQNAKEGTDVNPYVGTAADQTSVTDTEGKILYEVDQIINHPQFDSSTLKNNLAVITLKTPVDFTLSAKVEVIPWTEEVPAVDTRCVTSYWGASDPFEQVNQDVVVSVCNPTVEGTICSTYATPPSECPSGANGASLVCNSKLAGVFTAQRNSNCSAALWQYQEISKDSMWIWESVNAAPILNVSFAAILLLVTAMLKNL